MPHPYKSKLLLNLTQSYNEPEWRSLTWFKKGRDELLFVLPYAVDVKKNYSDLLVTLEQLPEIIPNAERCVISFCYPDGSAYCSRLINPVAQDQINLALIGYTPGRRITIKDLLDGTGKESPSTVSAPIELKTESIDREYGQLKAF